MQSYVIHLIRNAICEGNLERRYIGRTESPIAQEGIQQLLSLKQAYPYPKADMHYASPSTRCVDTLKLLYPQADPEVILETAEYDFGAWENKTAEDLKQDPRFIRWIEGGSKTAPPDGESGDVFFHRISKGFEMLVDTVIHKKHLTSVFVTYSGVLTTLLAAYGLPKASAYDWMCAPGCGYSIRITPMLWMRSRIVEVFDMLPAGVQAERDFTVLDLAREAADRAYGDTSEESNRF